MTIVERLRAEVVQSEMGLAELAKRTGIDRSNLNKFAAGSVGMNLENGVVLARALGVDLMGEEWRQVTYEGPEVTEGIDKALRDIPEAVAPERAVVHVPREELKAVKAVPRSSTPSPSIPGGPKRADEKPELPQAVRNLRRKLKFGDGG